MVLAFLIDVSAYAGGRRARFRSRLKRRARPFEVLKLAVAVVAIALPDCINPSLIGGELFVALGSHPRRRTAAFTLGVFSVTFAFGLAFALGLGDLILALVPTPGPRLKYGLIAAAGLVLVIGGTVVWIRRRRLTSIRPARGCVARVVWVDRSWTRRAGAPDRVPLFRGDRDDRRVGRFALREADAAGSVLLRVHAAADRDRGYLRGERRTGAGARCSPSALGYSLAGPRSWDHSPPRSESRCSRSGSCS